MLGFSIGKLIVLALIIGGVWYGFKFISRRNQGVGRKNESAKVRSSNNDVENMEKCDNCATFVPVSVVQNCGREGCPYNAAGAD